jgi:hypothetical protein
MSEQEQSPEQAQGAITKGEYENADGEMQWVATVTYACPLCGKKHRQQVSGSGKLLQSIPTQCKYGQGNVEVRPYR